MFTTWLGDMITERGLGNGISMIIMAGILARVPVGVHQIYVEQFKSASNIWQPILYVVVLALVILVIVTFVTYFDALYSKSLRRYLVSGDEQSFQYADDFRYDSVYCFDHCVYILLCLCSGQP